MRVPTVFRIVIKEKVLLYTEAEWLKPLIRISIQQSIKTAKSKSVNRSFELAK